MSITSKFDRLDRKNLLWPHQVWPDVFEDALKDNEELASALAHLIFNIMEAAAKGEKEIEKLRNTLKDGVEWIYPYTGAHKAAFKAYLFATRKKNGCRGQSRAPNEPSNNSRTQKGQALHRPAIAASPNPVSLAHGPRGRSH